MKDENEAVVWVRAMPQDALSKRARYTAPFRRYGGSVLARYLILTIGMVAMTLYTVPGLREADGLWLALCLWCCLVYFAIDSGLRAYGRGTTVTAWLGSPSGNHRHSRRGAGAGGARLSARSADRMAVRFAVDPQAHPGIAGICPARAGLCARSKAAASVLMLFLIVLVISSAVMHVV